MPHGEKPISFALGVKGEEGVVTVISELGTITAYMPAAQILELSMGLKDLYERLMKSEGVIGVARRDGIAHITPMEINAILPARGRF